MAEKKRMNKKEEVQWKKTSKIKKTERENEKKKYRQI